MFLCAAVDLPWLPMAGATRITGATDCPRVRGGGSCPLHEVRGLGRRRDNILDELMCQGLELCGKRGYPLVDKFARVRPRTDAGAHADNSFHPEARDHSATPGILAVRDATRPMSSPSASLPFVAPPLLFDLKPQRLHQTEARDIHSGATCREHSHSLPRESNNGCRCHRGAETAASMGTQY